MYASKGRGVTVKPMMAKPTKPPIRNVRTPRTTVSNGGYNAGNTSTNPNTPMTPTKSKFTERKTQPMAPQRTRSLRLDRQLVPSTGAAPTNPRSNVNKALVAANKVNNNYNKEANVPHPPPTATSLARQRLWNRGGPINNVKNKDVDTKAEKAEPKACVEIGVQTNEPEIVNRDLLIGDIKFLMPSRELIAEIDRNRQDEKKKALLKAQRKFEQHAEKQEEHLTDLKEFLEKAVITKRTRKPRDALELDRKLINSMDEILNRQIPKTESITDIRGRIKKKEKELLSLFETVDNIDVNTDSF